MKNQAGSAAPVLALEWGIKQSLVRYIAGMADGAIVASEPATEAEGGFRFPAAAPPQAAGTLRFAGSVTLTGHGGMLRLVVAEPWLVPAGKPNDAWSLTIADQYEPGARIAFATIDRLDLGEAAPSAHGTRLTADGADLFFSGPYTEGTELDDPRILGNV